MSYCIDLVRLQHHCEAQKESADDNQRVQILGHIQGGGMAWFLEVDVEVSEDESEMTIVPRITFCPFCGEELTKDGKVGLELSEGAASGE